MRMVYRMYKKNQKKEREYIEDEWDEKSEKFASIHRVEGDSNALKSL